MDEFNDIAGRSVEPPPTANHDHEEGNSQDIPVPQTLFRGAKGDDVKELQRLLNQRGYELAVDGDFGPITEAAVIAFQKANKMEENGIVWGKVWTALLQPVIPVGGNADLWLLSITLSDQSGAENVKTAQERLNQFGYSLDVDSRYGPQTKKALQHYQALRHSASDSELSDRSRYLENLQNDKTLGKQNKTDSFVAVAGIMLGDGYEPAYVAGLLANLYHEGNTGQFEISHYNDESKKPEYLRIMDSMYNYGKLYSGKTIMDVSLSKVEQLLNELAKDEWKKGKFGLGSIQWTGSRCQKLVEHYRAAAGDSDTITESQALKAEGDYVLEELKDVKQDYILIYVNWKEANASKLNSGEAADAAAQELCRKYEIPADTEAKAKERGKTAIRIYNIMSADGEQ